ncbi:MAG: poly-beta-1,6-N-acetyl-D-glucosamine N-deacetylase PgaB [Alphaproteobacteria bacterium]|nr:poly-beta-1,6-N-acetyl-D-glucosamine N-deacetylase PgaB [Alphaproteobacteria bacterium]
MKMVRLIALLLMSVLFLSGTGGRAFASDVSVGGASAAAGTPPAGSFIALCYHNVEDKDPDQKFDSVSTAHLVEQLDWLQSQGYKNVSIDDLLAARDGVKPLPPKAFLLSFDDGYESFYTRVYPVLRAFHDHAVIGIVDEWMKGNPGHGGQGGDRVNYGNGTMPRSAFLTWKQIREMEKSGLVEVASHTHAMHYGVIANPQGNTEPDALTSIYDPKTGTYETAAHYAGRLMSDAAASVKTIKKETGHAPRVMIWPYGAYNELALLIQNKNGMPITLSLDDGYAKVNAMRAAPRMYIKDDPSLSDFVINIRQIDKPRPKRVVQVDLDYLYDPDPAQEARNLDALISRIYKLQINTVFLQAFSDPTASGVAKSVYFPNRFLPVRQDLFNRVAWQLKTRAKVDVYAWMPVLSFDFGDDLPKVEAWDPKTNTVAPAATGYKRLSPFDSAVRNHIIGLYEDLARHAPIDGLLFHDDAMLSDFEDASPAAMAAYQAAGFPDSIAAIRANPDMMARWTAFKTDALIDFTQELAAHAEVYRAPLKTVRNIYALPVTNPGSEEWFAQNYPKFLKAYDYTAIEAMPDMENIPSGDQDDWLNGLVSDAKAQPDGLKKTIFELQSVDWHIKDSSRDIPVDKIGEQMNLLAQRGAMNFGYYPDDFIAGAPNADGIHKYFSLQAYPYLP